VNLLRGLCAAWRVQRRILNTLDRIESVQGDHTEMLVTLQEEITLMASQDQVAALAAQLDDFRTQLSTSLDGVQSDLTDLKAQVAAGQPVDLSALDSSVQALAGVVQRAADIDAETPAPADPTV
jgi:hypothetical protein